jgi:hypothetical protein
MKSTSNVSDFSPTFMTRSRSFNSSSNRTGAKYSHSTATRGQASSRPWWFITTLSPSERRNACSTSSIHRK